MTSPRTPSDLSPHALRVADLPQSADTLFDVTLTPAELTALRDDLDLQELRKLRLQGHISPVGKQDWRLSARLGATVVQTCVATLAPVTTRIDTDIERLFLKDYTDPDAPESEMPDEDHIEALGAYIDPGAVLAEALSLALPLYPRADSADPVNLNVTEPGKAAMTDDDAKPFAGLAALKGALDTGKDD